MKQAPLILIFLFLFPSLCAQKAVINEYAAIDNTALAIPESLTKTTDDIAAYVKANFKTEREKTRAIFIWIAGSIQYDVENMFALNFYEKEEEKISKPLLTRKGICANYAALFHAVCSKSGIRSVMIPGYTKQNGFTDYIPHVWCAAVVDGSWLLFDPTWGSGYINNGKFYRKINNDYCGTDPGKLIKSHMPFDYLWQFLNYPLTNQEFYEGNAAPNTSKPFFSYTDSIAVHEKLDHIEQITAEARRIEKNGLKNSMIFDRLQHLKIEIENDRESKKVNLYNDAVDDYNDGINSFNEFIEYRNKQFTPKKPDAEIQAMIDAASKKLKEAKRKLGEINDPDDNISKSRVRLTKSIDDAVSHVKEQQDWLKIYFSKNKLGRKSMFYKVTYFGVPVN